MHIATKSMPIVLKLPSFLEISTFVPTPSAAETSTGFLILCDDKSNNDPNPPIFLKPSTNEPKILVLLDSFDI